MRKPEALENLASQKFINWVSEAWKRGRNDDSLLRLLSPCYDPEHLRDLTYGQRVAKIYGYDSATQFEEMPIMTQLLKQWEAARKASQSRELALPLAALERLGVEFFKGRLETGCTFVLPEGFVGLARLATKAKCSALTDVALGNAFFTPRPRPCTVMKGDVVFTIVDSRPERRRIQKSSMQDDFTSVIVVRAHCPVQRDDCVEVPATWSLERWDVRRWCSSDKLFNDVVSNLLRVSALTTTSRLRPISDTTERHAPKRIPHAPHAPQRIPDAILDGDTDDQSWLALSDTRGVSAVLARLAFALEDGVRFSVLEDEAADVYTMMHLYNLGAVSVVETDDEDDLIYSIRPCGVRYAQRAEVKTLDYELDWTSSAPTSSKNKLDLLLHLYQSGVRPIEHRIGLDVALLAQSELMVYTKNLTRSRLYLEALAALPRLFKEEGLTRFFHHGPHHYYKCLLKLEGYAELNQILSLKHWTDADFKRMLIACDPPLALGGLDEDAMEDPTSA